MAADRSPAGDASLRWHDGGGEDGGGEDGFGRRAGRLAGMAGAVLGWSPDAFWRATPAELGAVVAALTGAGGGEAPPDAAVIARMREAFPDG